MTNSKSLLVLTICAATISNSLASASELGVGVSNPISGKSIRTVALPENRHRFEICNSPSDPATASPQNLECRIIGSENGYTTEQLQRARAQSNHLPWESRLLEAGIVLALYAGSVMLFPSMIPNGTEPTMRAVVLLFGHALAIGLVSHVITTTLRDTFGVTAPPPKAPFYAPRFPSYPGQSRSFDMASSTISYSRDREVTAEEFAGELELALKAVH